MRWLSPSMRPAQGIAHQVADRVQGTPPRAADRATTLLRTASSRPRASKAVVHVSGLKNYHEHRGACSRFIPNACKLLLCREVLSLQEDRLRALRYQASASPSTSRPLTPNALPVNQGRQPEVVGSGAGTAQESPMWLGVRCFGAGRSLGHASSRSLPDPLGGRMSPSALCQSLRPRPSPGLAPPVGSANRYVVEGELARAVHIVEGGPVPCAGPERQAARSLVRVLASESRVEGASRSALCPQGPEGHGTRRRGKREIVEFSTAGEDLCSHC